MSKGDTARDSNGRATDRATIIGAVKTVLGFYVLLLVIAEATLGMVATTSEGEARTVALYSMAIVLGGSLVVVTLLAYFKPEILLRVIGGQDAAVAEQQWLCRQLYGDWAERVLPGDMTALSLVQVRPDRATASVRLVGTGFDRMGRVASEWESIAACVRGDERKIYYFWRGHHPAKPNDRFEGIAEVSFRGTDERIDSGSGVFSDANVNDPRGTIRKAIEFRKLTEEEARRWRSHDPLQIVELVSEKLRQFGAVEAGGDTLRQTVVADHPH